MRGNFRASESRAELVRAMPSAAENHEVKRVNKFTGEYPQNYCFSYKQTRKKSLLLHKIRIFALKYLLGEFDSPAWKAVRSEATVTGDEVLGEDYSNDSAWKAVRLWKCK